MKKKKNTFSKVMAAVALISIVIGIIGTGILVIVESRWQNNYEITAEELQELINTQSWELNISGTGEVVE